MKEPIISIKHLTKEYSVKVKQGLLRDMFLPRHKMVTAVKDISFSIKKGESVALLGPNGAGKTTTMKMLSGLIFPSKGSIDILGHFPFNRESSYLKRIGLVMGNKSGLAWDLTPVQNFELIQKVYKIDLNVFDQRVKEYTSMLDIDKHLDTQVRKLSLGERMKMELIGSLLHAPEILFLDEPTIGLDIVSKQKIRKFLRDIQEKSQVTLLLTSHDMDDVENVSDRVIIINHGAIVFDNSMEKLLKKYKNKKYLTINLTEEVDPLMVAPFGHITIQRPLSFTIEIKSQNQGQIIKDIMEKLPVDDIDLIPVPLEEIVGDIFQAPQK